MGDLPLPSHFILPDVPGLTAHAFDFKHNDHQDDARPQAEAWFASMNAYHGKKLAKFMSFRFDNLAGAGFPQADFIRELWCINFLYWAFSFDDLTDIGEFQRDSQTVRVGVEISRKVFENTLTCTAPKPQYPYAAMLHDIWDEVLRYATPGCCGRFQQGVEHWFDSLPVQCSNRDIDYILPVDEFIAVRRRTVGGAMTMAIVEYALRIDLPDHVFQNPVIMAMHEAIIDFMTWPNDLCSFNKEQADSDFQNLVLCVMKERQLELQDAIYYIVQMIRDRLEEYLALKASVPSFGAEVDKEFARYVNGLEQFVQGCVDWYYSSRYFRDLDLSNHVDLVVPVFPRGS
ncbi:isoprenoid synthase domain-containing protein [Mycena metata]|uniref:Terpene synthase n=1 Tax=Mycena metata TaxID=1033252 RepID=A0AAD7IUJ6_9AGAR|nr:isoprenoid synthase domain-containing protein [Mycena metata]